MTPGERLEAYSRLHPEEVLRVTLRLADQADAVDEVDEVLVFRGFSSSLGRPTASDPEVPVIPADAHILTVDRLRAPYTPQAPQVVAGGLTWPACESWLMQQGL
ncbi:MAG: hypothetical protein IGQ88_11665 [Gloeomargaritaceae cyanobacterium C42_A2020_066]|nr:hypothetical protein [Gloeomargaritaceae cyanobacterium C42_A2020_066]